MHVTDFMNSGSRWKQALYAAGMATVLVCNVLLFAPFAIHSGNPDEFSATLPAILAVYALPGFVAVLAMAAIGGALPAAGFARYLAGLSIIAILMWLQGTFLVWDYGPLDGASIPWLKTGWRGLIDSTLWIALLVVAFYGYRRFGRPIVIAAGTTFAIQLLAIGAGVMSAASSPGQADDNAFDESQYEAIFRFSSEKNVLHIVMDGFQTDVFEDIVADPDHQRLADALSGFTVFTDNLGTFPYTQMTMPLLVSGKAYTNSVPVDAFTENTMRGDTILNSAAAAGFEIDIATQVALRKVYAAGAVSNFYDIPADRHASLHDYAVKDAARLFDLSLFRLAPHFVKAYIHRDELWFVQSWFRERDYLGIRYFSELRFLEDLATGLRADRDTPVYKLFHLMLSHRPTVGNEQCEYDGKRQTWRNNVTIQARCGLERVVDVLEALKKVGVYDNTVIVLMADHGAWIGVEGFHDNQEPQPHPAASATDFIAGMAVPVLAIKPAASSGPMQTSTAPTTIADVPATLAALLGIEPAFDGRNVFDIPASEQRTRTFFNYAYGKNHKHPGYLYPLAEYEVRGTPFKYESWRHVGMRLPGGVREPVQEPASAAAVPTD